MMRELDRLQNIGATNIRLLAGSETSPLAGAISRGITRAPHDYDEDLLAGLDFCLAEMAKRNMRAILFVSNYWQWSGGFAQYVRWITGDTIPDPDKPVIAKGDWSGFMKFSARLYVTPAANQLYLDYVSRLIQRRNTVERPDLSRRPGDHDLGTRQRTASRHGCRRQRRAGVLPMGGRDGAIHS